MFSEPQDEAVFTTGFNISQGRGGKTWGTSRGKYSLLNVITDFVKCTGCEFPIRRSRSLINALSEVRTTDTPVRRPTLTRGNELEGHGKLSIIAVISDSVNTRLRPAILPYGRLRRNPCSQRRETRSFFAVSSSVKSSVI